MRILVHSQYYPPEMGAPQARLSDLAGRLRDLGHEVIVLTALPNYPTGRVFEGYRGSWRKTEILDGIEVRRTWIWPSNKRSFSHRLISYLSFSASSFFSGLFSVRGGLDLVITESPPLFLAPAGWLLARLKGAKWIMNVSDLWPDSVKYIGMMKESHPVYRLLSRMARFFYRSAWLVTGQSRGIIEEVKRQEPRASTWHLTNGVDLDRFGPERADPGVRAKYFREGEAAFVYAGLHGFFQGLDQIIEAAELLKGEPVRFVLIGDGPEKRALKEEAERRGLENVSFHPPLPHREVAALLASADVAVVTLKSEILGAVPSKIYEAMASGRPVLLAAAGEPAEIVNACRAGITVKSGEVERLAEAARRLAESEELREELGASGLECCRKNYDRREIARRFAEVIDNAGKSA